ncbi:MAG: zinc ribbon domain-containing protein [Anaerolineales bacterium]
MGKIFALLTVWFLLSAPGAAQAQAAAAFQSASVKLWPEYDRPDMLVICDFVLAPASPTPSEVTLRIPAAAGEPYVVAIGPSPAAVSDQNVRYETRPAGDWLAVTIHLQPDSRAIRLEYYDPRLVKENHTRRFQYEWPADYAVESLRLSFQLPVGASRLLLNPPLSEARTGGDGLQYYEATFGPLEAGETFRLSVTYQKASDALSVASLPIQPAGPLDQRSSSALAWNTILPWVLGILGFLLLLGGLTGIFHRQQGRHLNASAGPRRRRRASQDESLYCHRCGKRAQPGDRFCRACGTRLRRSEE